MNPSDRNPSDQKKRKWIEISIESILGQPFQIIVAPFERIFNLKERIEYTKGISVSQQRLIFQSVELQDDMTVEELKIQDGAKLTLIPAMKGGPLNYRRVELKETLNPDILRKLAEMASDEADSGKAPVVIMVVNEGQLLNIFQLHDSDSSFESLSSSFFEFEEGSDEESDEEKEKKEENERLHQRMTALRKRMDSIAVDKSKVDLPKPVPPTLNRVNSIRKISQTTSTKPAIHGTKQPEQRPNETSVALHATVASAQLSTNRANVLLKQSGNETGASSRKNVLVKSQNLLHDGHRKSSISSNRSGTVSSAQFGGSLPQIRTQRSVASTVRRNSLPGKTSTQKDSYNRKRNSIPSDDVEVPAGLNSSSYKALNNYLKFAETFPGGSRYHKPLETVTSQVVSMNHGSLNSAVSSANHPQQKLVTEAITDKKPVIRCAVCSKKTGLATTYECRCMKKFCAVHRYPEAHGCTYDYKGEGRKELKESNPVVVAPKLPKI